MGAVSDNFFLDLETDLSSRIALVTIDFSLLKITSGLLFPFQDTDETKKVNFTGEPDTYSAI